MSASVATCSSGLGNTVLAHVGMQRSHVNVSAGPSFYGILTIWHAIDHIPLAM